MESPEKSPKKARPVWGKMCRYSIYFTILGATLSIVRYKMAINMLKLKADQSQVLDPIGGLTDYIDTYLSSFYYLLGFTLLGFISLVISLFMLRRERS